jgi:hypothetical protein
MESDPPAEAPLVCAECGLESPPDAASWRAYLDDDGAGRDVLPGVRCPGVRRRLD